MSMLSQDTSRTLAAAIGPADAAPPPPSHTAITFEDLNAALLQWERIARAGGTRSAEEAAALPAEQVAEESAQYLGDALRAAKR